ncbi:ferric-chelate reductase [Trichosporon asahii var. asahii CBS 2479]|uniref:ferric-chelate reductase (NADPH) n=1 Tax=Trichosporon asahii var. asahii (strain ATCC 90039 / CBS 2479 / JCM 2466 / KCTC 7840 / NBRC 103889/ NCYC 2677 / UAMH 7654) TaxID=1186058 RepID=J6EQT2_TRIAS|nr:ferric-chelate reductase [Trichosporon asahii var. asahii CBS 2479]EJT45042.1 ferric-chelate reductase [Trichosporon asahii var. asahii CBS 2479]
MGFARQLDLHNLFGWCMYALLAVMTAIGLGNRLLAYAARRGTVTWTGNLLEPWPRLYAWYRRYIGTPAMMGYRNAQPWGILTIPTRLQAILVAIYVTLNVVMGCYGYDTFENNMFWLGRQDLQLARYVADRTGIMSFYNMVLLWLLAGRNDIILWLTGWSYPSLNLFHRWTARVAVVQGLVHSAGYAYLKWGKFWPMMRERYWWSGVYGMLAMGALIPLSILPFRRYAYEAFLLLHIGLSAAFLALMCIHTDMFGYDPFVWLCVGIWLFDRVLRLLRVVVLSYRTLGARNAVGVVTAIEPGLMRLSVDTSVPITPRPGDYYFLYSPHSLTPWENHPFTLASWEKRRDRTTLHFLIAPQAGWTWRLRRRIEAATLKGGESAPLVTAPEARLRVLLEGPYGTRDPIDEYDHILLLAGGSGIAAILPYVYCLGQSSDGKAKKRRISVVWTVRNAAYAADVFSNELAPERTSHISLDLYLTQEEPASARAFLAGLEVTLDSGYGAVNPSEVGDRERRDVVFSKGRPPIRELLAAQIEALSGTEGSRLAVLACGPGAMMDDLRADIADAYGSPILQADASRLDYWLEYF